MPDDDLMLTVPEAAARLRLGAGTVYRLVRENQIPALRAGRRILIPRAALEAWVANLGRSPSQSS